MDFSVRTAGRNDFVDITRQIQDKIRESGVKEGICAVYCPHTTAGVTVNEGADPSVVEDILREMDKCIPWEDRYSHIEGNSAAHIKSSLVGASLFLIIQEGRLRLGTWQKVFFAEFDGPRQRQVWLKIIGT